MWVISMSSTKGGGGKTTFAAHLAVEAVKHGSVAIIDTDPQASLAAWWNLREAETPAFVQTTLKGLPAQLKALRDADYQLVIIDTPARLRDYAKKFGAGPQWHHYTGTVGASIASQRAFGVYRGDKMSHTPVMLVRAAPNARWVRFEGFASADQLLAALRPDTAAQ